MKLYIKNKKIFYKQRLTRFQRLIVMIVLISLLILILSGCCGKQVYDTGLSSVPLHRLSIVEKPACNIRYSDDNGGSSNNSDGNNNQSTYKDLVDCLLEYKGKLDQSNQDKEEIIKILNNNK